MDYNLHVSKWVQEVLRFSTAAAMNAAIIWIYFKVIHVNPTTVGFTFLLAVLVVSATWGLKYSIFTALMATIAYNYFFLPPLFKFTIADPQNCRSAGFSDYGNHCQPIIRARETGGFALRAAPQ